MNSHLIAAERPSAWRAMTVAYSRYPDLATARKRPLENLMSVTWNLWQGTRLAEMKSDFAPKVPKMHTTDRFLRFAAECEVMAKFARNPENKAVWNGLAQRWLRCAELMDREHTIAQRPNAARRQRTSSQGLPH